MKERKQKGEVITNNQSFNTDTNDSIADFEYDDNDLIKISDTKVIERIISTYPEIKHIIKSVNTAKDWVKISIDNKGKFLYFSSDKLNLKFKNSDNFIGTLVDTEDNKKSIFDLFKFSDSGKASKKGKTIFSKQSRFSEAGININAETIGKVKDATLNIASYVVSQHYMATISSQLTKLDSQVSTIGDFLMSEYKSRVKALIVDVIAISDNQDNILTIDDVCSQEKVNINRLEHICEELLGQANDAVNTTAEKVEIKFAEYENDLKKVNTWYKFQEVLYSVLGKIAELKYALNKGNISFDSLLGKIENYRIELNSVRDRLLSWHETNISKFKVSLDSLEYKNDNVIKQILSKIPKIKDHVDFTKLKQDSAEIILEQLANKKMDIPKLLEKITPEIKMIVKDGIMYFVKETVNIIKEDTITKDNIMKNSEKPSK